MGNRNWRNRKPWNPDRSKDLGLPGSSQMTIQPIETVYQGYKFRSKLEARWALYFDLVKVAWDYEPDGYDLGDLGWYLPDFYLPDFNTFIEIKPKTGDKDKVRAQLMRLTDLTGSHAWGLFGDPYDHTWMSLWLSDGVTPGIATQVLEKGWHEKWSAFQISFIQGPGGTMITMPSSGREPVFSKLGNIQAKKEARQARFDHGQTPKKWKCPTQLDRLKAAETLLSIRTMLGDKNGR